MIKRIMFKMKCSTYITLRLPNQRHKLSRRPTQGKRAPIVYTEKLGCLSLTLNLKISAKTKFSFTKVGKQAVKFFQQFMSFSTFFAQTAILKLNEELCQIDLRYKAYKFSLQLNRSKIKLPLSYVP